MTIRIQSFVGLCILMTRNAFGDENPEADASSLSLTDVGIKFVPIQAGSFERIFKHEKSGDLENLGRVELDGFMISETEISWEQLQAVVGKAATEKLLGGPLHSDKLSMPVSGVGYFKIRSFCEMLTTRLRANEDFTGRVDLPTEAQWEYVSGSGTDDLTGENVRRIGESSPSMWVCGSGAKNSFGVYDMIGNVSEFCRDVFVDTPPVGENPITVGFPDIRKVQLVVRGGSFFKDRSYATPFSRFSVAQTTNPMIPDLGLC